MSDRAAASTAAIIARVQSDGDRAVLEHGIETGIIKRLPHGEFIEVHQPLSVKDMAVITSKTDHVPLPAPERADADGSAMTCRHRWQA